MHRSRAITLPLVLALLLGVAPFAAAQTSQPAAPPDPSTPKGALKALAMAMARGDSEGIHHLMDATTPAQEKMVDMMAEMAAAMADLNHAMLGRFGEQEAKKVLGGSPDEQLRQSLSNIDAAKGQIKGDDAIVSVDPSPQGTMLLRKVGGSWKVRVGQQGSDQQVDQQVAMIANQVHSIHDIAAEVRDGKYPTAAAAAKALVGRMGADAAPPASQPATQPMR